jgi:hypothetical protein
MSETSWYEMAAVPALLQGDLFFACPVTQMLGPWSFPVKTAEPALQIVAADVVVMTQSCDLENQKTDMILLASVNRWRELVANEVEKGNVAVRSRDFRKKLIEGNIPGLSLLHKHDGDIPLPWSVIDFHRLYMVPKPFLEQFAASQGPRLRLRSPYREHLAQAFARYFMRVGLPHDAKAFEKEGDVAV